MGAPWLPTIKGTDWKRGRVSSVSKELATCAGEAPSPSSAVARTAFTWLAAKNTAGIMGKESNIAGAPSGGCPPV